MAADVSLEALEDWDNDGVEMLDPENRLQDLHDFVTSRYSLLNVGAVLVLQASSHGQVDGASAEKHPGIDVGRRHIQTSQTSH